MKPQTGMHYINIAGFKNQTWNFTKNDIWQKYKFSIISLMWKISEKLIHQSDLLIYFFTSGGEIEVKLRNSSSPSHLIYIFKANSKISASFLSPEISSVFQVWIQN